jgi:hypothetical protein
MRQLARPPSLMTGFFCRERGLTLFGSRESWHHPPPPGASSESAQSQAGATLGSPDLGLLRKPLVLTAPFRLNSPAAL